MRKDNTVYFFLILSLLSNLSGLCSNVLLEGVSDSVIAQLKIKKCVEIPKYDAEFLLSCPNAYYAVYDTDGFVVEKNSYSSGDINDEFIVYFLNDDQGDPISWVWLFPNDVNQLTRVRFEKYDSLGNNIGYMDTSPGMERSQVKFEKYFKGPTYSDTIFVKSKMVVSIYTDSIKAILEETRTLYYTDAVIDSIIVTYAKNSSDVLKVFYKKGIFVSDFYKNEKGGGRGREVLYRKGVPYGTKYFRFKKGNWIPVHESILKLEFYE